MVVSDLRVHLFIAGFLVFGLSAGCNLDDNSEITTNGNDDNQVEACENDETQSGCDCPGGATGYQICAEGEFGECVCDDQTNACGGTSELSYDGDPVTDVGADCGPCDDGTLSCDGEEAVQCSGASSAQSCMDTGSVELTAHHEGEDYLGDRLVSVYLLENFNRDCQEAVTELDDPAVLRPIDSIDELTNPLELTVENVPVGIDYTTVTVIHSDRDDFAISLAVGCEDVTIDAADEVVEIADVEVFDLPAELSDEYQFRLFPVNEHTPFFSRWIDYSAELNFDTDSVGDLLFGCLVSSSSCGGPNPGAFPVLLNNWDDVEPFTTSWNISNLYFHTDNIDNASQDLAGSWEFFWWAFEYVLDERWASIADGNTSADVLSLGDQMLISFDTLTTDLVGSPSLQSDWETFHPPWEFSFQRDVSFEIDQVSWVWGMNLDCFSSGDVPAFDDGDCETQTLAADDVYWGDNNADLVLRSFGSHHVGFKELTYDMPVRELIDYVWEDHLSRLEAEFSLGAGNFFSTLFNCSLLESELRTFILNERDEYDSVDFTDAELDNLMSAFAPLCEEFEDHGADFFAAGFKYLAYDQEAGFANSDAQLELDDYDMDERYLFSFEPESYPDTVSGWTRPFFDHIINENSSSSCNHWLFDSDIDFATCIEPEIQALGW